MLQTRAQVVRNYMHSYVYSHRNASPFSLHLCELLCLAVQQENQLLQFMCFMCISMYNQLHFIFKYVNGPIYCQSIMYSVVMCKIIFKLAT